MRLITSPRAALAVLLAGAVMLAACGGGEDGEADAATPTPTAEPTTASGELIATATPFASRPTPTMVKDDGNGGGSAYSRSLEIENITLRVPYGPEIVAGQGLPVRFTEDPRGALKCHITI